MQRGLCRIVGIVCSSCLCFFSIAQSYGSEADLFARIQSLSDAGESKQVIALGKEFHKKYPSSARRGEVYVMMAQNEVMVDDALAFYRKALKFLKGTRALHTRRHICQILQLTSRWDDLKREAEAAYDATSDSENKAFFLVHLARAYLSEQEYEKAAKLCEKAIALTKDPDHLLPAYLLLSHTIRKETGYSQGYFSTLRNILEKFNCSEGMPSALYLLGKAYYHRQDYNKAYSTFRQLQAQFPRSPEASLAAEKIAMLEKRNPTLVPFIPDDAFLQSLEKIDLNADYPTEEEQRERKMFYAVMLGPLDHKSDAIIIARSIKDEFAPVRIVRSMDGYSVFAGNFTSPSQATTMKIRLAEEMGYNGKVVRFRRENNKTYIYGE